VRPVISATRKEFVPVKKSEGDWETF